MQIRSLLSVEKLDFVFMWLLGREGECVEPSPWVPPRGDGPLAPCSTLPLPPGWIFRIF